MAEMYYTLEDMIEMIDEPNRDACKNLYANNKESFDLAKGSKVKHQARLGGYRDHVTEVMNIAIRLFESMNSVRPLPFTLSDSLLALYLHDLEKPWKYSQKDAEVEEAKEYTNYQDFIYDKINEYDFQLSDEVRNALLYIHGEGDDHNPHERIQGPLAAFVHCCDTISARIWFDFPNEKNKR